MVLDIERYRRIFDDDVDDSQHEIKNNDVDEKSATEIEIDPIVEQTNTIDDNTIVKLLATGLLAIGILWRLFKK